jgi:hypothetical protein
MTTTTKTKKYNNNNYYYYYYYYYYCNDKILPMSVMKVYVGVWKYDSS